MSDSRVTLSNLLRDSQEVILGQWKSKVDASLISERQLADFILGLANVSEGKSSGPIDSSGIRNPLGVVKNLRRVLWEVFGEKLAAAPDVFFALNEALDLWLVRAKSMTELTRKEQQLRLVMDAVPALISYLDGDRRY